MKQEIKELEEQIAMWERLNVNGDLENQIAEAKAKIEELKQQDKSTSTTKVDTKSYTKADIVDNNIVADTKSDTKATVETETVEIIDKPKNNNKLPKKAEKKPVKPPFSFNTSQTNVVIPTKDLIKHKDCDFRVLLGISGISNCDDPYKEGDNERYVSLNKLDRRAKDMCETIGIEISNFNKKLRTIIKKKSNEFKVVERQGLNNTKVKCYQIDYEAGGFITIPVTKAERCLLTLGNNPIKLYCNLLWLCQKNGEFEPTHVPQQTLATLMGLSPRSEGIVKASMQTLINNDLIDVYLEQEIQTVINEEGLPISKPVTKYYYDIIIDEEDWKNKKKR